MAMKFVFYTERGMLPDKQTSASERDINGRRFLVVGIPASHSRVSEFGPQYEQRLA